MKILLMKFKELTLFLIFFILTAFQSTKQIEEHALYIGVIKIDHEPNEEKAIMTMRVFSDDLKSALRNTFGYESISEKPSFCDDYESYINQYFIKRFTCTVNRQAIKYRLSSCNRTEEVSDLEFLLDCPSTWDSAKVEAEFFMELFPNQSNIVKINCGSTKRFGRATKGNEVLRFVF